MNLIFLDNFGLLLDLLSMPSPLDLEGISLSQLILSKTRLSISSCNLTFLRIIIPLYQLSIQPMEISFCSSNSNFTIKYRTTGSFFLQRLTQGTVQSQGPGIFSPLRSIFLDDLLIIPHFIFSLEHQSELYVPGPGISVLLSVIKRLECVKEMACFSLESSREQDPGPGLKEKDLVGILVAEMGLAQVMLLMALVNLYVVSCTFPLQFCEIQMTPYCSLQLQVAAIVVNISLANHSSTFPYRSPNRCHQAYIINFHISAKRIQTQFTINMGHFNNSQVIRFAAAIYNQSIGQIIISNLYSRMNQRKGLSFSLLKRLVQECSNALQPPKQEHEGVLVIGAPGVGKTTFISLITGLKLCVKKMRLNTIIEQIGSESPLKIRHDNMSSASLTPVKMTVGKLDFYDCPSFGLQQSRQFEISYYYFLKKVLSLYRQMKIVLVVQESYLTEPRLKRLPGLLRQLKKWVSNLSSIKEGVILVINKAKASKNVEDYLQELDYQAKKLNSLQLFEKEELQFLSHLVKEKRVVLFRAAAAEEVGQLASYSSVKAFFEVTEGIGTIKGLENTGSILKGCSQSLKSFEISILQSWVLKSQVIAGNLRDFFEEKRNKALTKQSKRYFIQSLQSFLKQLKNDQNLRFTQIFSFFNLDQKALGIIQDVTLLNFIQEILQAPTKCLILIKQIASSEIYHFINKLGTEIEFEQSSNEHAALADKIIRLETRLLKQSALVTQQRDTLRRANEKFVREQSKLIEYGLGRERQVGMLKKQLQSRQGEVKRMQQMLAERSIINGSLVYKLNKLHESLMTKLPAVNTFSPSKTNLSTLKDISPALLALHSLLNYIVADVVSVIEESPKKGKGKKYPEIDCAHFLNGGQCWNCIKDWKNDKENKKVCPASKQL